MSGLKIIRFFRPISITSHIDFNNKFREGERDRDNQRSLLSSCRNASQITPICFNCLSALFSQLAADAIEQIALVDFWWCPVNCLDAGVAKKVNNAAASQLVLIRQLFEIHLLGDIEWLVHENILPQLQTLLGIWHGKQNHRLEPACKCFV